MALTSANSIKMGSIAPHFELLDIMNDEFRSLNSLQGKKGTLILFICNHCPYVIHVNKTLVNLANQYQKKGIAFIAISSNDAASYPEDAPDRMKEHATQENYPFPYLYDESQNIARAYGATCTPDLFLYDDDLALSYHGQLDASRPGNGILSDGADMVLAFENLLAGKPTPIQKASIGCSIKWKVDLQKI